MKIKILTLLLLSSFILSALTAVPSKINYQGIITDIDGSPIVSSANTITALLYATELGGAALYTQSFVGVNSDTNGMYSVEVGDGSLQSVLEGNSELWLELIINEQTLSPRQKINSVPYALVAKAAESIVPGSDTDAAISANASDIQAHDVRINTLESGSTVWTNNASNIQAHNVRINMLESGATVWSSNASDIQAHDVRINTLEGGATMWTTNASDIQAHDVRINTLEGGATMWTTNASDISALQAEVELNPAKELVQYGFEENLFLSETTSESSSGGFNYAGSTHFISGTPASDLDISDRILLVAQNSAHQNGIYVVLHKEFGNAYIIRAEDFNSDEDVSLGIFTVIEKGVLSGEGFVLDLIAENFILDDQTNGTLGFSKFTNSALETRLDSLESQSTYWLDNYNFITNNSTRLDSLESQSTYWLDNYNSITNNSTRLDSLESQSTYWLDNYNSITNNSTQISNNATAITALQSDVDQNEADADAAIAALQAVDASSARQFVVDFGFTDNKSNLNSISLGYEELVNYSAGGYYTCEVGDTVLLTGQSDSSENGIYEITYASGYSSSKTISLARSSNYDTAEEFNEGDLVLIEKGGANGLAFMLGAIPEAFVLGNDALTWYRCGINTNQDIDFEGVVTVAEIRNSPAPGSAYFNLGTYDSFIRLENYARFDFEGYSGGSVRFRDGIEVDFQNYGGVDFDTDVEFSSTVTVQTPTQDNEVANKVYVDTAVATNTSAVAAETSARATAITTLQAEVDQNESDADAAIAAEATTARAAEQANANAITTETSTRASAITALQADVDQNESDADVAIAAEASIARAAEQANASAITSEVARAEAVEAALQSDIDQNESDADAAIAALQAVDASSARQFVVDFGFTYAVNLNANIGIDLYNYGDGSVYSCEVGDTVLLTGQSNSSENGIYEITNVIGSGNYRSVSLVRSTNYDTAEELNEGDLVLIEKGESNGLAFMLGAIPEAFVLGNDALTWYRCGINTNQDIDFAGTVGAQGLYVSTPGGYIIFDGMNNSINSSFETRFDGNDVRFTNDEVRFDNYGGVDFDTDVEFNSTVTAQAPTQDNEVANKLYVDSVVVPSGGLIAWPSASGIPTGWSDAGLSSPMTDYIWIRKD